jgi:hypothetical protein
VSIGVIVQLEVEVSSIRATVQKSSEVQFPPLFPLRGREVKVAVGFSTPPQKI